MLVHSPYDHPSSPGALYKFMLVHSSYDHPSSPGALHKFMLVCSPYDHPSSPGALYKFMLVHSPYDHSSSPGALYKFMLVRSPYDNPSSPGALYKWGPDHACWETWWQCRIQRWKRRLDRSPPIPACPCPGLTIAGHTADQCLGHLWVWLSSESGQSRANQVKALRGRRENGIRLVQFVLSMRFPLPPTHTYTHTHTHTSSFLLLPPWQQNILSSTMAAIGRQLKQSVNVFHIFTLYRRLPSRWKWNKMGVKTVQEAKLDHQSM